jgi:hypothetical protein
MSEKYRKLTESELKLLGITTPSAAYKLHRDFAKRYYPSNATTLVLALDSEYNDNTYNNTIKYVVVYDVDGNELPPLKATAKQCRDGWSKLDIPGTSEICGYGPHESREEMSDLIIQLTNELPELYVKISN